MWLILLLSASFLAFFYFKTGGVFKNIIYIVVGFSILLSLQNLFTLVWMLYGWSSPESGDSMGSPKNFLKPTATFSVLVPAKNEDKVIGDTITCLNSMNYPKNLYEVLVLCRTEDIKTINVAQKTIDSLENSNIKLVIFDSNPVNKPHSLNVGLENSHNQVVTIFDAEDEPHPDLLNVANTVYLKENPDIIQSGVQLMNYESKWFSALNVLEYYFWFKSGLHFFSKYFNATPLAGNSVFFKKELLNMVRGWDENCLTEDADIGVRIEKLGAKVRVIYDEEHATQEETPHDVQSFIKQRTRWNQGFIQILFKGDWMYLPKLRQQIISVYIFTAPILNALLLAYIPIGFYIALTQKLPLVLTLVSYGPFYLMLLQLSIYGIGLYKFTKGYKLRFSVFMILHLVITYYPYQMLLTLAAFRALFRELFGKIAWEKTKHLNYHRS